MIKPAVGSYLQNIACHIRLVLDENLTVGVVMILGGEAQLIPVPLRRQEADLVTENGCPVILQENDGFLAQSLVSKIAFEAIQVWKFKEYRIYTCEDFLLAGI